MKIEHMVVKSHLWTTNPQAISTVSVQPKPYIGMRFMNGHENSCSKWADLFVIPLTTLSIIQTVWSQKWMIITNCKTWGSCHGLISGIIPNTCFMELKKKPYKTSVWKTGTPAMQQVLESKEPILVLMTCVTITRMDKPKDLQRNLILSSMSKKHQFSAQELV